MNRAGSWPAMASTISTSASAPDAGVTGSTSPSIMASNDADSARTALGVKPRFTSRRCFRCCGSSLAIMFDSVGVSLTR